MRMKRINACLLSALMISILSGCANEESTDRILRIYNWQDYIYEGDEETGTPNLLEMFEDYYEEKYNETIKVEYYTFETNENMLNVLRTGKSQYDLVCPSDYVIQKMIKENMLEKFDTSKISNFNNFGAKYIKSLFERSKVQTNEGEVSWIDYSIPYMWGTMGFMYNPENVDENDIKSWAILWDEDYKYKSTLKDSVRDTYVAAAMYVHREELAELKEQRKNNVISDEQYNESVGNLMNSTSDESLSKIEEALRVGKVNTYGFEVDSGKSDIVTGKIDINFCWSGDAVYALDCAEEESDVYLNYYVPDEGSNVWFDGWVMPKGAQKDLAHEFVDFLCNPEIAALNMDYIGYTSAVAGEQIFDLLYDWYSVKTRDYFTDEEWNKLSAEEKNEVFSSIDEVETAYLNGELYKVDLSYLFEGTVEDDITYIYTDEINRQFSAQYPDYETIVRCAVMEDFGDDNEKVISMWIRVKSDEVPTWIWAFICVSIICVTGLSIFKATSKKIRNERIKSKRN